MNRQGNWQTCSTGMICTRSNLIPHNLLTHCHTAHRRRKVDRFKSILESKGVHTSFADHAARVLCGLRPARCPTRPIQFKQSNNQSWRNLQRKETTHMNSSASSKHNTTSTHNRSSPSGSFKRRRTTVSTLHRGQRSLSANKGDQASVQASVVMEIPSGYHVNSSRPLEKFLIPTQLKVEAPDGIRVGPVSYPRPVLRKFKFSKSNVSVYEGRAPMRVTLTVPAGASVGSKELKVRLRYQSCNDEVCFPPQTKELSLWLNVSKLEG